MTNLVLNKRVVVQLLKRDQYNRAVAMPWVKKWLIWRNVSKIMTENGYATLYTSAGAEYGGLKHVLEKAESSAKRKKLGMWSRKHTETPMDFKKRMKDSS